MPSVPKYLRTIFPHPLKGCCFRPNDRAIQCPKSSKKMSDSCAHDKRHQPPGAGGLVNGPLALWPLFLVSGRGRWLRHVDRVGGGKAVLEPLLQRLLEPALALLLAVALGLLARPVLGDGFIRNSHAWPPCGGARPGVMATTRNRRGRSPVSPAGRGKYNRRMRTVTGIEDLRRLARRKVPRAFFDYAEAGSYSQETLHANREDLERIRLRQRVLVDVSQRDLATTIVGEKVSLPLALAPIGLCGMQHGDGEILACRAAQAAGIPFTLSTMSICSIEDVAKAVGKPFWFQLYVMKDRGFIRALIERAAAARCSALVLTVDLQVLGQRHCDIRNGMTVPPQIRLGNL